MKNVIQIRDIPDKMYKFLAELIPDLIQTYRLPGYVIDLHSWVDKYSETCYVCLAGVCLINHFKIDDSFDYGDFAYIDHLTARKIQSLDSIRSGLYAQSYRNFYNISIENYIQISFEHIKFKCFSGKIDTEEKLKELIDHLIYLLNEFKLLDV